MLYLSPLVQDLYFYLSDVWLNPWNVFFVLCSEGLLLISKMQDSDWAADEELGAEATRNPKHRTADAKILSLSCILEISERP